jgi:hypothetical protein
MPQPKIPDSVTTDFEYDTVVIAPASKRLKVRETSHGDDDDLFYDSDAPESMDDSKSDDTDDGKTNGAKGPVTEQAINPSNAQVLFLETKHVIVGTRHVADEPRAISTIPICNYRLATLTKTSTHEARDSLSKNWIGSFTWQRDSCWLSFDRRLQSGASDIGEMKELGYRYIKSITIRWTESRSWSI